jgi:hypothetical protein
MKEKELLPKKFSFLLLSISSMRTEGMTIAFPYPKTLLCTLRKMTPEENGTLEGISFADDFKTLYVSLEGPLYQDGPRASLTESNSWV